MRYAEMTADEAYEEDLAAQQAERDEEDALLEDEDA